MNIVQVITSILVAGLFALVAAFAATKITGQLGTVRRAI